MIFIRNKNIEKANVLSLKNLDFAKFDLKVKPLYNSTNLEYFRK